ncbi:MAG: hypothetical protein ACXVJD_13720 [Mucilaginibacter sp.]
MKEKVNMEKIYFKIEDIELIEINGDLYNVKVIIVDDIAASHFSIYFVGDIKLSFTYSEDEPYFIFEIFFLTKRNFTQQNLKVNENTSLLMQYIRERKVIGICLAYLTPSKTSENFGPVYPLIT